MVVRSHLDVKLLCPKLASATVEELDKVDVYWLPWFAQRLPMSYHGIALPPVLKLPSS